MQSSGAGGEGWGNPLLGCTGSRWGGTPSGSSLAHGLTGQAGMARDQGEPSSAPPKGRLTSPVLPTALTPAWGHRDTPKAGCLGELRGALGALMAAVRITPTVTPPGLAWSFKRCFGARGVKFILGVIRRGGRDARRLRRCWRGTREGLPCLGRRNPAPGPAAATERVGGGRWCVPVPLARSLPRGHVPWAKPSLAVTPVGTCLSVGVVGGSTPPCWGSPTTGPSAPGDLQAQPRRWGTSPSRGRVALGRCWPRPQGWGRDAGPQAATALSTV